MLSLPPDIIDHKDFLTEQEAELRQLLTEDPNTNRAAPETFTRIMDLLTVEQNVRSAQSVVGKIHDLPLFEMPDWLKKLIAPKEKPPTIAELTSEDIQHGIDQILHSYCWEYADYTATGNAEILGVKKMFIMRRRLALKRIFNLQLIDKIQEAEEEFKFPFTQRVFLKDYYYHASTIIGKDSRGYVCHSKVRDRFSKIANVANYNKPKHRGEFKVLFSPIDPPNLPPSTATAPAPSKPGDAK